MELKPFEGEIVKKIPNGFILTNVELKQNTFILFGLTTIRFILTNVELKQLLSVLKEEYFSEFYIN